MRSMAKTLLGTAVARNQTTLIQAIGTILAGVAAQDTIIWFVAAVSPLPNML